MNIEEVKMLGGCTVVKAVAIAGFTGILLHVPVTPAQTTRNHGLRETVRELAATHDEHEQGSYEVIAQSSSVHTDRLAAMSRYRVIRGIMDDAEKIFGTNCRVERDVLWRYRGAIEKTIRDNRVKYWVESVIPIRPVEMWKNYCIATESGSLELIPFQPEKTMIRGEFVMILIKNQTVQGTVTA